MPVACVRPASAPARPIPRRTAWPYVPDSSSNNNGKVLKIVWDPIRTIGNSHQRFFVVPLGQRDCTYRVPRRAQKRAGVHWKGIRRRAICARHARTWKLPRRERIRKAGARRQRVVPRTSVRPRAPRHRPANSQRAREAFRAGAWPRAVLVRPGVRAAEE